MLPDEPLDTALADAVTLGQLALWRSRSEGNDELLQVVLTQPVPYPPLTGAQGCRADDLRRTRCLRLCLAKLLHRADQRICKIPAF